MVEKMERIRRLFASMLSLKNLALDVRPRTSEIALVHRSFTDYAVFPPSFLRIHIAMLDAPYLSSSIIPGAADAATSRRSAPR